MELQGKVVAVTGASGGIGSALVEAFGRAGADVTGVDRPGTGADLEVDVTDAGAVAAAIAGLDRLDVVVANAGIGVGGLAEDIVADDWQRTIDVNISGVVNTVLPAYERMRAQRSGTIVLMGSLSGLVGTPLLTPYAMSKHAIVGLAASLRPEAARHGIGVTVVCPGPVETPMLDTPGATAGATARRHLVNAAGKPMAPEALADAVVDAVRRNRPMVVAPGRSRLIARLARWVPGATARQLAKAMDQELTAQQQP